MSAPTRTHTGGCLCGAIRYRISQDPVRSGICHCRTCRKIASAASLPFSYFPAATFAVERGEPRHYVSSPGVVRSFCGDCGSALTYRSDAEPGFLDVMTVTLDAPNAYPPADHLWVSEKLAWDVVADGLPAYSRGR